MTVSVHQPQYLPWLGYFDKIARVDVFVFLDTVQYKKNEFQNRNRIRTTQGWQWLTVPVHYRFPERICEVTINNGVAWGRKHAEALRASYGRSPHWADYAPLLEGLLSPKWDRLSALNRKSVTDLMAALGIATPVRSADEWALSDDPTGRLVDICLRLGADTYLSGAGGRGYLDVARFEAAGIGVIFQHYEHPVYPQRHGAFEPYMSVVDLLFNCGGESPGILASGRSAG